MPRRHFIFVFLFAAVLSTAGCSIDMTGVDLAGAFGSGGCCAQPAPACTTTCAAMDPGLDQRILVGDTIEIFFRGGTIAATWKYDSTVFAPTQPSDFVNHHGTTVSHIAFRALAAGINSITANVGADVGQVAVETILPSKIRGLDVKTLRCSSGNVTDPICSRYAWDTASFKTGDTLRALSSTWTTDGGLVNAKPRWTTSNPNVVTVSQVFSNYDTAWLPILIAKGPGVATISATVAGYSGSLDVTVVK